MVYLISDLLNASRINTGKFVIDKKPVKLKSVIENEIKQLSLTAEARDIKLTAKLGDKDPVLNLDANKLKQVIMNFIDNAIYYSERGSEVVIDYHVTADAVELQVKDNGIGVPKEALNNLFTKFYRAENAKRVRPDGTGLGLFLAKKVITAQGGFIIFESEIGEGSTFGFRFALSAVATNEEPTN
jgi:signal transduction histidine kinase